MGSTMLGDELVLGLEQTLAVTYSTIVSEFIDPDSLFLTKHSPPHTATTETLRGRTCLAVLSERTAQTFLEAADATYVQDTLTSTTVVLPVPCDILPQAPKGWHAIRILQPGHQIWVRTDSDTALQPSERS